MNYIQKIDFSHSNVMFGNGSNKAPRLSQKVIAGIDSMQKEFVKVEGDIIRLNCELSAEGNEGIRAGELTDQLGILIKCSNKLKELINTARKTNKFMPKVFSRLVANTARELRESEEAYREISEREIEGEYIRRMLLGE